MDHVQTLIVLELLTECWVKYEEVTLGKTGGYILACLWHVVENLKRLLKLCSLFSICRCMASSLVRTGFVRGSMTQGNGCYQHRCINNTLEVCFGVLNECAHEILLLIRLIDFHKVTCASL